LSEKIRGIQINKKKENGKTGWDAGDKDKIAP
jgi:hypothetical protein